MGSGIYIRVDVKPYIKTYFEKSFGNPVKFPKSSYINYLLGQLISKPPKTCREIISNNTMCVELPFYIGKNVLSYNYLSETARAELKNALRQKFYKSMFDEVHRNKKTLNITHKAAILMFIEKYELDPACFESLKKQEYRERKLKPLITEA